MASTSRAKKPVEYFFIDMNDPERYKKLKVSQACDFCRRRKSKCDVGVPGSGSCSNCRKAGIVCIFASQSPACDTIRSEMSFSSVQDLVQWIYSLFPLLGVNTSAYFYLQNTPYITCRQDQSLESLEQELLEIYFSDIHPYYPILTFGAPLTPSVRSAALALACVIARPDMITLSSTFADHAHANLNSDSLSTAQTLLLLYKYHETTFSAPEHSPYLDRARHILDSLPSNNLEVSRAKWILYINICWSGYNESDILWKQWCNERDMDELMNMDHDFAALVRITHSYFRHHSPSSPLHHHQNLSPQPQPVYHHHQHHQGDGPFYPYVCLINAMMLLPSQHVQAADQIEHQVRNLAGTIAQRASIQGSRILTVALKLGLHAYICYYASTYTFHPSIDIMNWTRARLSHIMELFQTIGVHPSLCTSIQHLIDLLYQGCFHMDHQTPTTAGTVC